MLEDLDAVGTPLYAITNWAEDTFEETRARFDFLGRFRDIVVSGRERLIKPDPRIFAFALDRFGVSPARALHLGDVFATDVLGARAAGIRCGLIDPFGHYDGAHPDVPRVPGAVEVARAILEQASAPAG